MNRIGSPHDSDAAPAAATPPARFLPGEALDQPHYVPRRRLGALEAAAATAVIVACVVALASMTGLLPASMHRDIPGALGAAAAGETTVASSASGASAASGITRTGSSDQDAAAARAADNADAAAGAGIGTGGASPVAASNHAADGAARSALPVADLPAQPAITAQMSPTPDALATGAGNPPLHAAAALRPHHGGGHAGYQRRAATATVLHGGAAGQRTGKTREQVIAELMQSKRDGTYPAQTETYR